MRIAELREKRFACRKSYFIFLFIFLIILSDQERCNIKMKTPDTNQKPKKEQKNVIIERYCVRIYLMLK